MEHGEGTGRDNALFDSGDSSGNNAVTVDVQTDAPDTEGRVVINSSSDDRRGSVFVCRRRR